MFSLYLFNVVLCSTLLIVKAPWSKEVLAVTVLWKLWDGDLRLLTLILFVFTPWEFALRAHSAYVIGVSVYSDPFSYLISAFWIVSAWHLLAALTFPSLKLRIRLKILRLVLSLLKFNRTIIIIGHLVAYAFNQALLNLLSVTFQFIIGFLMVNTVMLSNWFHLNIWLVATSRFSFNLVCPFMKHLL